jgi:hypothetical protein
MKIRPLCFWRVPRDADRARANRYFWLQSLLEAVSGLSPELVTGAPPQFRYIHGVLNVAGCGYQKKTRVSV